MHETQLPIFEVADEPVHTLTERQQFALEELLRHREGLMADELGALLHHRRGSHDVWQRCKWCGADGLGVLKSLRKKGLVKRTKSGEWRSASRTVGGELDPRTMPFPEGF